VKACAVGRPGAGSVGMHACRSPPCPCTPLLTGVLLLHSVHLRGARPAGQGCQQAASERARSSSDSTAASAPLPCSWPPTHQLLMLLRIVHLPHVGADEGKLWDDVLQGRKAVRGRGREPRVSSRGDGAPRAGRQAARACERAQARVLPRAGRQHVRENAHRPAVVLSRAAILPPACPPTLTRQRTPQPQPVVALHSSSRQLVPCWLTACVCRVQREGRSVSLHRQLPRLNAARTQLPHPAPVPRLAPHVPRTCGHLSPSSHLAQGPHSYTTGCVPNSLPRPL
jgi:hypothetical protein